MWTTDGFASVTRRAFVKVLGIGGASFLAGRRDAMAQLLAEGPGAAPAPPPPPMLLLHNNENPLGPGQVVFEAVRSAVAGGGPAGRYPLGRIPDLHKAIAESLGVAPESIVTGSGSTQILRASVQVLTSPWKPLVTGHPSYEESAGYAALIGTLVKPVPVDAALKHDLDALVEAAPGAGMLFIDNPGNPTATVHSADAITSFIDRVQKASPDTTVVIDEAYHDYVTDPSYRSQAARAAKDPHLLVARTFSKAHGMAGMRVGFAVGHPDVIKKLASWEGANSLNVAGIAGALASIRDAGRIERERARNTEVRRFVLDWFARAGFKGTDSQTNFLFVNIGRPAKEFREACGEQQIRVARDFPPFEKTHVRISLGTMEEMQRATEVFGKVLGVKAKPDKKGGRRAA